VGISTAVHEDHAEKVTTANVKEGQKGNSNPPGGVYVILEISYVTPENFSHLKTEIIINQTPLQSKIITVK